MRRVYYAGGRYRLLAPPGSTPAKNIHFRRITHRPKSCPQHQLHPKILNQSHRSRSGESSVLVVTRVLKARVLPSFISAKPPRTALELTTPPRRLRLYR